MSWWVVGGILAYIAVAGYVGPLLLADRYAVSMNERAERYLRWTERHPDSLEAKESAANILAALEEDWRRQESGVDRSASLLHALWWPISWPMYHFAQKPETPYLDTLVVARARETVRRRKI